MTKSNNLEIVVQTKDFVHALSFASSVVEKRNVLSELSKVLRAFMRSMLKHFGCILS